MKRTTGVTLGVIMSALIATGCGDEKKRCVDANNVVVAEEFCKDQGSTGTTHGTTYSGYRYYYGGSGHTIGSVAHSGGYVSRGGFGSSSSSHSSSAG